ncbi:class I SAM-dependent methyltransferase [Agrobacterium rosae]
MPTEFSRRLRADGFVVHAEPLPDDWSCNIEVSKRYSTVIIYVIDEYLASKRWMDAVKYAAERSSCNVFCGFSFTQPSRIMRCDVEVFGHSQNLRKHPAYYNIISYNEEDKAYASIFVPFMHVARRVTFTKNTYERSGQRSVDSEDMTRIVGGQSNAALFRYNFASHYLRRGDVLLDFPCGTGYGPWIMASLSNASSLLGMDPDDRLIEYAKNEFYSDFGNRVRYRSGSATDLTELADDEYDLITCFDFLDRVDDVDSLLRNLHRILRPGGRLLVGIANSDLIEGAATNSKRNYFNWKSLRAALVKYFIPESGLAQSGGTHEGTSKRGRWASVFELNEGFDEKSDWCVAVVMKSPLESCRNCEFDNRQYGDISAPTWHLTKFAEQYENPWLVPSLLQHGALRPWRIKSPEQRNILAERVLCDYRASSADYAAAIAVLGHYALEAADQSVDNIYRYIELIDNYLKNADIEQPIHTRWTISLLFLKARLLESINKPEDAITAYEQCCSIGPLTYGPAIATKTITSFLQLGYHYSKQFDFNRAEEFWRQGVEAGRSAIRDGGWLAAVGDENYPDAVGLFELMDVISLAQKCAACLDQRQYETGQPPVTTWSIADNNKDAWLRDREHQIDILAASLLEKQQLLASIRHILDS